MWCIDVVPKPIRRFVNIIKSILSDLSPWLRRQRLYELIILFYHLSQRSKIVDHLGDTYESDAFETRLSHQKSHVGSVLQVLCLGSSCELMQCMQAAWV